MRFAAFPIQTAVLVSIAALVAGCGGSGDENTGASDDQLTRVCGASAGGAVQGVDVSYYQGAFNWAGAGGTSFSSPIFAGIQALINQKTGTSWGNTNTAYYALAATEYGAGGNPNCNSNLGAGEASTCVFNDVTSGDFNVNCRAKTGTGAGLHNCYLPSGTNGVGTTDATNASYHAMYKAAPGWDFTSGVGTPNVNNLVNAMNALPH